MPWFERVDCPPDGPLDARIAFVGARPGYEERIEKRGFVGASGRLLWRLSPIPRTECYVTNVRKDYSTTHDTPTMGEIRESLPGLREELERTRANLIICVGGDALYALTGLTSIEKYRGSVVPSTLLPGRKVLSTWHPAAALRAYQLTYVIERDLRRAIRESHYPDIRRPPRTYSLGPSFTDACTYIRGLGDPLSIDIETFGEDPSCIALSDSTERAICIPFIGGPYTNSELAYLWRVIDDVLRTRRIIGQNIQFDTTRLESWGFQLPNLYFDTMLAHHLLWPDLGGVVKRSQSKKEGIDALAGKHSLAFLVSMYTEEPYYKDEGGFSGDFERYWTYNCKDAATTYECYLGLEKELEVYNQTAYFQEHVMGLIRPVMAMQSRGLCVDFSRLNTTRKRLEREIELLQLRFNAGVGFDCNVRSPDDIRELYTRLNVKPTKRTKKKQSLSTDEDTLRSLAYNSPHAGTFQQILDIRERRTLVSGFLGLETNDQGRYAANYLIHGTDSGRLSSRAARKGPQLQNIPKSARRIFVVPPGHTFIQGDLRRAEAMYVAYDSQDPDLINIFNDPGRDLYREMAETALSRPIEKKSNERECFKRAAHASHYGMGPKKFLIVLRLQEIDINEISIRGVSTPFKKAEYILDSYHNLHPNIHLWQEEIRATLKATRALHDAFGRRRIFLGRMDDHLERIAFSYKPQATIVNITNRALRLLHQMGYKLLLQVHDSIAIETPEDAVNQTALDLQNAMTCPLQIHGREMIIPVDIQIGKSWGELTDWMGDGHEGGHAA